MKTRLISTIVPLIVSSIFVSGAFSVSFAFNINDRVMAAPGGVNVRDGTLTTLFTQVGGVHGTIVAGPYYGTAGGYTGNWWEISWDSGPPAYGHEGWSAESVISLAPTAGDVPEPSFSTSYYTTANIFWQSGNAPASTSPPNPQLGSALGNCTWYACGRMLELGFSSTQVNALHGNASQWASEAQGAGISVNTTPTVHSIAQSVSHDHVAVVESVNNDGTITVTESSYFPTSTSSWDILWRHRTVSASWFDNFIHLSQAVAPPTITSVTPSPSTVTPGGTFAINAVVNASQTQPVLIGASLFPAGTTQNEIDDSAHDISSTLYSGNNNVSRSFTVPLGTQTGTYDLVFGLWQDVNGDGKIDAGDTELASKTVSSAVAVQPPPAIVYSSIAPSPASGTSGTVGQNLPVQVTVSGTVNASGYLQVWIYDSSLATTQMYGKYLGGQQSLYTTIAGFSLSSATAGSHDYTVYTQFRPGATSGPLLSTGINDIIQSQNYTVNWQSPADTTPPTISITSPTTGSSYPTSSSTVSLSGTANDNVAVVNIIWSDKQTADAGTASGTTSWSINNVSLASGANTITVTAYDAAGNHTSATLTVTYNPPDTTGPALTISSPVDGAVVTSASLSVSGTASDSGVGNNGISSVTVNGVTASGGTASGSGTANWSATLTLAAGANTITVVAKDTLNNATQKQITVTYNPPDTTGPALTISSPADGAVVTSASLSVSGTASDSGVGNNGISSVTVNGVTASGGTASGSGTANWSATLTLAAGANTITVVAKDTLNNATQKQITVTYNPPAPVFADSVVSGGKLETALSGLSPGESIVIEVSTNLRTWTPVQTNSAAGSAMTFTNTVNPGTGSQFFRVRIQ